jgi:hypothetical protein
MKADQNSRNKEETVDVRIADIDQTVYWILDRDEGKFRKRGTMNINKNKPFQRALQQMSTSSLQDTERESYSHSPLLPIQRLILEQEKSHQPLLFLLLLLHFLQRSFSPALRAAATKT